MFFKRERRRFKIYIDSEEDLQVEDSLPPVASVSGRITYNLTNIAQEFVQEMVYRKKSKFHVSDILGILEKYNLLYNTHPLEIKKRRDEEDKAREYVLEKLKKTIYKKDYDK